MSMPDDKPKPRMTFWGERIETVPQHFKERLKKIEEQKEAEAAAVKPAPTLIPKKR